MEKPILFNTEMVKAILEGKKTCTRRVVKEGLLEKWSEFDEWQESKIKGYGNAVVQKQGINSYLMLESPYEVGDVLYVRETWCDTTKDLIDDSDLEVGECKYVFKVDDNGYRQPIIEVDVKRWRPSIHMPKEAARIFLEVTNVRVERLQDITEEGAREEGVRQYTKDGEVFKYAVNEYQYKWSEMPKDPIEAFKKLWDNCYNWPKCWTYNPWVWVIEFKKVDR